MEGDGFRQRVHAQFIGQNGPAALKGAQGLILLALAIVGFHDQPPGALAAGVVVQHLAGVVQRFLVAAQGQVTGSQVALHLQKRLAQSLPGGDGPVFVGVLGQIVTPVEGLGGEVGVDGGCPFASPLAGLTRMDAVQEGVHVDLAASRPDRSGSRAAR